MSPLTPLHLQLAYRLRALWTSSLVHLLYKPCRVSL